MDILELDSHSAMEEIKWIKYLLNQLSSDLRKKITSGTLDELIEETIRSPQTAVCMATKLGGDMKFPPAALYLATIKPALLIKVLHIDLIAVSMAYKEGDIVEDCLIPHMRDLAGRNGCSRIELATSDPTLVQAFKGAGFTAGAMTHLHSSR